MFTFVSSTHLFRAGLWTSLALFGSLGCEGDPFAAIGGGDRSIAQDLCERFDECNMLDEISVEECISDWEDYLAELSSAERIDCDNQVDECLEKESCDNFGSCEIPDCL